MVDHVRTVEQQWERERPDLDVGPQAVFGRLHRLADRLRETLISGFAEHDLGEGEFDVLATLRRNGPPYEMRPADLARSTMVTSGAATKQLARLESAGLVTSRPVPDDARAKIVALTDLGRQTIDAAFTRHIDREHHLLRPLTTTDRRQLVRLLQKWTDGLDDDQ